MFYLFRFIPRSKLCIGWLVQNGVCLCFLQQSPTMYSWLAIYYFIREQQFIRDAWLQMKKKKKKQRVIIELHVLAFTK